MVPNEPDTKDPTLVRRRSPGASALFAAFALALGGCVYGDVGTSGKDPENIVMPPEERARETDAAKKAKAEKEAEEMRRQDGAVIGDSTRRLYHRQDCKKLGTLPPAERVPFASPYEAFDRGFAPCPSCER